ncbi:MAG: hypothetical protein INR71_10465 [Terriglobus roseus]|nr:hypothetical protein [Terriglobus roseus]
MAGDSGDPAHLATSSGSRLSSQVKSSQAGASSSTVDATTEAHDFAGGPADQLQSAETSSRCQSAGRARNFTGGAADDQHAPMRCCLLPCVRVPFAPRVSSSGRGKGESRLDPGKGTAMYVGGRDSRWPAVEEQEIPGKKSDGSGRGRYSVWLVGGCSSRDRAFFTGGSWAPRNVTGASLKVNMENEHM